MKKLSDLPKDKKIIAIDFDGTLTLKDNRVWSGNYASNDIMEPNDLVISWVKENRNKMYLILWTCRVGICLERAIQFCLDRGIIFDAINENILSFECSPKIMADVYIDDKSANINQLGGIL